jgi:hypothetical protein
MRADSSNSFQSVLAAFIHRLRKYAAHFESRPADSSFFLGPSGKPYSLHAVYTVFRPKRTMVRIYNKWW